jgi:tetratricopeptide (TPR) repeat protein
MSAMTALNPFAQALALHQSGRLAEAEKIYRRILEATPDHFDSLHLLGVIFHQRGQHAQAVRQIDLALRRSPQNPFALNNRGVALGELKRFDEALASFDRAIAAQPDYADAHSNRGNMLKAVGRFAEALASFDRALALRPDFAEAHSNRGDVLATMKRPGQALDACDRALVLRPDFAEAHCNRGNALQGLQRFEEAVAACDRALTLQPDFAEAHSNRGNALHELGRFDEALAACDRAVVLRPDFAAAHCNRGNALQELARFDDAVAAYDRALVLQPDFADAHYNRGNALGALKRSEAALAGFARAVELRPDFADAHFNEALCRLVAGDLARGWEKYEWRWQTTQIGDAKRVFDRPLWLDTQDIAGKTILLHAEQGMGDTIQFCRYVPLVAERGARVILEVPAPLHELMRSLGGGARIVTMGEALPDFDVHCPLLSLPLAFRTTLDTIPARTPYLYAAADKARVWRDRFGSHDRPRVGLVWAGNPRKELPGAHRIDRRRSMAFDRLAPLFAITDSEFYSLQKGDAAVAQLRASPSRERVVDWTDDLHDFSDTAALIENLDLVIAVDTSVAHLAGALGKPFWLLNRDDTCWRWLRDRDDSPWYPTARQFRQDDGRDWDNVIARVQAALADYVAAAGAQDCRSRVRVNIA